MDKADARVGQRVSTGEGKPNGVIRKIDKTVEVKKHVPTGILYEDTTIGSIYVGPEGDDIDPADESKWKVVAAKNLSPLA